MDKIEYQDVLPIDTSIPMGIELEFAKADIEDLNNKLKIFKEKDAYGRVWCTKDEEYSQYKRYGGEVVSPVFFNTKQAWKTFKEVVLLLENASAYTTDQTSFQVSIDKGVFKDNPTYLKQFLLLWTYGEAITYRFTAGEKEFPRQNVKKRANPCGNLLMNYLFRHPHFKEKPMGEIWKDLDLILYGKLYGINIDRAPMCDRIELRPANSSLDIGILQNTILYYVSLVKASLNPSLPWDFLLEEIRREFVTKMYFPMQVNCLGRPYGMYQMDIIKAKEDLEKAKWFASLLYDNEKDTGNFIRQYTKKF